MVDYEYILFCYNVLKSGKVLKIDKDRITESKKILSEKSDLSEDDKVAIFRLRHIESFM